MGIKYRDNSIIGVYAGDTSIRDVYAGSTPMWHNYLYNWTYNVANNGRITLLKYKGSYSGTVTVPNAEQVGHDVQINKAAFTNTSDLTSIDLQHVPFQGSNMTGTFSNCQNLVSVQNLSAGIDMSRAFANCVKFNQDITIPSTAQLLTQTFSNCRSFKSNITIQSSMVRSAANFFNGTTLRKNVYFPFNYTGTTRRTNTFNAFRTAGYLSSSGIPTGVDGVVAYNLPLTRGMRFDPPEEESDMR